MSPEEPAAPKGGWQHLLIPQMAWSHGKEEKVLCTMIGKEGSVVLALKEDQTALAGPVLSGKFCAQGSPP